MVDEAGLRMGAALRAVLQMQADSVKLLRDLDRGLQGYKSLFGNYVTSGIGSSINTQGFLADGMFRHYSVDGKWGRSLAATICFFDLKRPERLLEPVFVAANLEYIDPDPDPGEKQKRAWDAWYAYVEWAPGRKFNEVIILDNPEQRESLARVEFVAAPLYSITDLQVATSLLDRLSKGARA